MEDVGRSAYGTAERTARYAGDTAIDVAFIPINLADRLPMPGRNRGPGYEMAVEVIGKNRFSRSLTSLASRAVERHPLLARNSTPRSAQLSGMLNPCPEARIGRSISGGHDGLDMMAPTGTSVYAALPGTVIYSGREFSGYGNIIIIGHGQGLCTLYSHNSRNIATYGQTVQAGTRIALVGSTGRATAPHVHFEVRHDSTPIDPLRFISR